MAQKVPCFICGDLLAVKLTKKQKPVLTCNSCGVQIFVRYVKGIERLDTLTQGRTSIKGDFVVCRACQVAVRRTKEKIQNPILGRAGIYCPECDALLLKSSEV
jgi:hypothetical protein